MDNYLDRCVTQRPNEMSKDILFGGIPRDLIYIILSKIIDLDTITSLISLNLDNKLYKMLLKLRFPDLYNDLQKIVDKVYYRKLKDGIYLVLYHDSFDFEGDYFISEDRYETELYSDITINLVRSVTIYRMYPYLFNTLDDGRIYKAWPIALYYAFLVMGEEFLIDPKELPPGSFKEIMKFFQNGKINGQILLDIVLDNSVDLGNLGGMIAIYIVLKMNNKNIIFSQETKRFVKHIIDSQDPRGVTSFDDEKDLVGTHPIFYWHVYNYIIERKNLFGIN
jgi:hypothetical protein